VLLGRGFGSLERRECRQRSFIALFSSDRKSCGLCYSEKGMRVEFNLDKMMVNLVGWRRGLAIG